MTRPVEEFEVSALIDGELDPARAAEVRSAIESDPALRVQFVRLSEADRAWAGAARSAQFLPGLVWNAVSPLQSRSHAWVATALALMVFAGRIASKILLLELPAGVFVQGVILAAIIAAVVYVSRSVEPEGDAHARAFS